MFGETKKIHIIEEILKISDANILQEVEDILLNHNRKIVKDKNFSAFAGSLTDEDVNELQVIIDTGCEKINTDDWK